MRSIVALACALTLSGCMSFSVLDAEMPKYQGRHIDTLVSKLGLPNAEQQIMGRKVYIWTTSMQHVSIDPVISTTTGYIGTRPISMTSTSYQASSSQLSCTIRVFVDNMNVINGSDYNGNNGACFTYSKRLEN